MLINIDLTTNQCACYATHYINLYTESRQMRYAVVLTNEELVKRFKQACHARKLSPGAFATIFFDEHLPPLTIVHEKAQTQPQEAHDLRQTFPNLLRR